MKQKLSRMLGFTMIELLVVIAVIGVLAVAVLSAINPLEQINKGRDTRLRSDAAELLNSVERYFSTQELFPWNVARGAAATNPTGTYTPPTTSDDPTEAFVIAAPAAGSFDDDLWNWVGSLADVSEVKPQFAQRLMTNNPLGFAKESVGGAMGQVYVCFRPSSKQFQLEAARKCCTVGCPTTDALAGTAPTITGLTVCATTDGTVAANNLICLP